MPRGDTMALIRLMLSREGPCVPATDSFAVGATTVSDPCLGPSRRMRSLRELMVGHSFSWLHRWQFEGPPGLRARPARLDLRASGVTIDAEVHCGAVALSSAKRSKVSTQNCIERTHTVTR